MNRICKRPCENSKHHSDMLGAQNGDCSGSQSEDGMYPYSWSGEWLDAQAIRIGSVCGCLPALDSRVSTSQKAHPDPCLHDYAG